MNDLTALATIARRSAELDVATDPAPVLETYGLTIEAWLDIQDDFLAQIADDLDRGETERAELFSATYDQRRGELLGAESSANDNGGHATGSVLAAPPDAAIGPATAPPSLATFQHGVVPSTVAEPDPDATAMLDNRAAIHGMKNRGVPFDLGAPAIPVPPPQAIIEDQSGEKLADMRDIRAALAARGIAIGPDTNPPIAPPVAVASPLPADLDADATAEIDSRQIVAALRERGILPFDKDAPPAAPPPSSAQDQSGETQLIDARDIRASLAARGIQIGDSAPPKQRRTEAMDLTDFQAQVAAKLAQDPSRAPLPIPLERFALVQAALTKSRDRDGVLRHYGFEPDGWKVVAAQLGAALSASAGLRARYEELYREAMKS